MRRSSLPLFLPLGCVVLMLALGGALEAQRRARTSSRAPGTAKPAATKLAATQPPAVQPLAPSPAPLSQTARNANYWIEATLDPAARTLSGK
jgi:hypothetical protein